MGRAIHRSDDLAGTVGKAARFFPQAVRGAAVAVNRVAVVALLRPFNDFVATTGFLVDQLITGGLVAAVIGGAIAFKPAMALLTIVNQLNMSVPGEFMALATDRLPPIQLIVTGGMLLVIAILSVKMLEE